MKSSFLSHKQLFDSPTNIIKTIGTTVKPTDLVLLTIPDDGFVLNNGNINYYLDEGKNVDRFGGSDSATICATRPVIQLEQGEEKLLKHLKERNGIKTVELGYYPSSVLDSSLRSMAEKQYQDNTLVPATTSYTINGTKQAVYRFGAKQIIRVPSNKKLSGFTQLSDGSVVGETEDIFLEVNPIRWFYDEPNKLLIASHALFYTETFTQAKHYLEKDFIDELLSVDELENNLSFKTNQHAELELIKAFIDADIPVFIHGLTGDGKSDRVKEIDPDVIDIELVNETPETINGRTIYNEAKDEIIDIKPVWLVRLEKLCEDGKTHILFFDELTNATKQTQTVIFKIVLERIVNNRWTLPTNARIVAAGNDRSESSVAHDLAEPLFGRFAHVYIKTTIDNWMPWAIKNNINPYILEFLANNDLYLRTAYTGLEANADPRRWEMASKVLDSSNNDFSLLAPVVGNETAEAFTRFFLAQQQLPRLAEYSDEELARFSIARKYQLAQQCLSASVAQPKQAKELVTRLGPEFLAWFEYVLNKKQQLN